GATSTANLVITITGTNDAPVANGDTNTGATLDVVKEAGLVDGGNTPLAGDPTAIGNVLTNDNDGDHDAVLTVAAVAGDSGNVGASVEGTYGSVQIAANSSYTYTLSNTDADTNALKSGEIVTDTFAYTMTDEHGATSTANLVITISGTNAAPDANTLFLHDALPILVKEAGLVDGGNTPLAGDPTA